MSRKAGVTQAFRDPVSGLLHVRGRLRACARLLPCHGLEKESGPRSLRFRQVSVRSPREECTCADSASGDLSHSSFSTFGPWRLETMGRPRDELRAQALERGAVEQDGVCVANVLAFPRSGL